MSSTALDKTSRTIINRSLETGHCLRPDLFFVVCLFVSYIPVIVSPFQSPLPQFLTPFFLLLASKRVFLLIRPTTFLGHQVSPRLSTSPTEA